MFAQPFVVKFVAAARAMHKKPCVTQMPKYLIRLDKGYCSSILGSCGFLEAPVVSSPFVAIVYEVGVFVGLNVLSGLQAFVERFDNAGGSELSTEFGHAFGVD